MYLAQGAQGVTEPAPLKFGGSSPKHNIRITKKLYIVFTLDSKGELV